MSGCSFAVIGLDLSLTRTGWANDEGFGAWPMDSKLGDKRLVQLRERINDLLWDVRNEDALVVIEDLPKNAMSAGITGQVQGIARELIVGWDKPYMTVPAATLKKAATGSGTAKKEQMAEAYERFTGLPAPNPKKGDEVDAWFLRQMGLAYLGQEAHLTQPLHEWATRVRIHDYEGAFAEE